MTDAWIYKAIEVTDSAGQKIRQITEANPETSAVIAWALILYVGLQIFLNAPLSARVVMVAILLAIAATIVVH